MRKLFLLLACSLIGNAHAATFLPAEGVWQFPDANGSGLTLDYRDGTIGIGLYTYDDAGANVWYSGAGRLIDGVLETSLAVYREGASPGVVEQVGEAKSFSLVFSSSTQGVLDFDGTADIAVQHAAFGADYMAGWSPGAEAYALPDLRGRWLFAERQSPETPQPTAYAIEFAVSTVDDEGRTATFRSIDYPVDGLPDAHRAYEITCGPQANLDIRCLMSSRVIPLSSGETPVEIGQFDPRDLSPNRVVGTGANADLIGFRMPSDPIAAPSPGIWQIVGRNGSGLTLDVRENSMAVGVFSYDAAGKATWSLAQGPIVQGTLAAPLQSFTGGSCLGCPQQDPVATPNPNTLNLQFIGATRALLTIGNAAPVPVSLLPYGHAYSPLPLANDSLAGEFGPHLLPLLSGEWVFSQGDIATERAPDSAIALDFVDNHVAPDASSEFATFVTATTALIDASPTAEWDSEMHRFECGTFGDAVEATCEARYFQEFDDLILDPPVTFALATAAISDVSGNRILATGAGDMSVPVWGFRIPPREMP